MESFRKTQPLREAGASAVNRDAVGKAMESFRNAQPLREAGASAVNRDAVGKAMESFRKAQHLREAGISAVNRDAAGKAMESFRKTQPLREAGASAVNRDAVGKAMESFRKTQYLREAGISAVNRDAIEKAMESFRGVSALNNDALRKAISSFSAPDFSVARAGVVESFRESLPSYEIRLPSLGEALRDFEFSESDFYVEEVSSDKDTSAPYNVLSTVYVEWIAIFLPIIIAFAFSGNEPQAVSTLLLFYAGVEYGKVSELEKEE
ncbi:hypothetical protein SAMN05421781_0029 [Marinococcus luteus]|uniref:Uncharacterized protein n=1 Tax=Marinococcus luteus TaxID=1122204 RepID=A0A1H2YBI0_9BACI|nr:hypothetical protein [Marinococcus luteus]SDX02390.1 hypothetical protein SAMN05421781_0029 [Marinococcus luteus]